MRVCVRVADFACTSEYEYFAHVDDEMQSLQTMHAEWRSAFMELSDSK